MSIKEQLWIEEALLRHDKRNWWVPQNVIITPCRDCHPNSTVRVHYQGPGSDLSVRGTQVFNEGRRAHGCAAYSCTWDRRAAAEISQSRISQKVSTHPILPGGRHEMKTCIRLIGTKAGMVRRLTFTGTLYPCFVVSLEAGRLLSTKIASLSPLL